MTIQKKRSSAVAPRPTFDLPVTLTSKDCLNGAAFLAALAALLYVFDQ